MLLRALQVCVWALLFHTTDLSQEPPLPIREVPLNLITTLSDAVCVANTLYGESRGEPPEGSRAVFDVIQERMIVRDMSACQVVSEPGQFAGYSATRRVTKEMLTALATTSRMSSVVERAEYFHTTDTKVKWKHVKRLTTIGHHVFFRRAE